MATQTTEQVPTAAARPPAKLYKPKADWANRALVLWGILVFIFLFAPIVVIVVFSFNTGRLLVDWNGFGFDGYQSFLDNPAPREAVKVSVIVGVFSAIVATVLGSLAGVALARRPGKWSAGFLFFVALVLVTPEIVDAVALLPWYVTLGNWGLSAFDNGWVRLIVSHSLFSTAVVALIVRARMSGIDETLEEAAGDLYAPPVRRFTQITLPLMMPAVLAGALLSFTLSLDNTIISSFVQVQGVTPWPVYVFSSVKASLRPEIAAVSTLMFMLTLVAIGLVALVLRRGGDSSSDIARTMTGGGG
ncbi:MAG TPA: ABC transporter permease [Actinomycetes bacterium]|nr:ABC transporter permease [Actinomycetes bacterium]